MKKKAQASIELILLLFFALIIMAGVIAIISYLAIELQQEDANDSRDELAKMITKEFEFLTTAQNGYSRELIINPNYEKQFNISINKTYMEIKNIGFSGDRAESEYYFFPKGARVNVTRETRSGYLNPVLVIRFEKELPKDKTQQLQLS